MDVVTFNGRLAKDDLFVVYIVNDINYAKQLRKIN